VKVFVTVGVGVKVEVEVAVGVDVVVAVGVAVTAITVMVLPAIEFPVTMAPCPVVWPFAVIPLTANPLKKVLLERPDMFKVNTSRMVCGSPETRGGVMPFWL
jgi:hypothetical protein